MSALTLILAIPQSKTFKMSFARNKTPSGKLSPFVCGADQSLFAKPGEHNGLFYRSSHNETTFTKSYLITQKQNPWQPAIILC